MIYGEMLNCPGKYLNAGALPHLAKVPILWILQHKEDMMEPWLALDDF